MFVKPEPVDKKITIQFLPKNTTSKIQPLDQGIISKTKHNYRRHLVNAIIESTNSLQDYLKSLNIKETRRRVQERCLHQQSTKRATATSMDSTKKTSYWQHVMPINTTGSTMRTTLQQDRPQEQTLTPRIFSGWQTVDDNEPTANTLTDEEIIHLTTNPTPELIEPDDTDQLQADQLPTMTEVAMDRTTMARIHTRCQPCTGYSPTEHALPG